MSLPASLTIVLPAFDEEARIGPALDELFGYLRRGASARGTGRPARPGCPTGSRSWSWTTAAPTPRPRSSRPAPEAQVPDRRDARLRLLSVPHGGKGAAVRGGHAGRDLRT